MKTKYSKRERAALYAQFDELQRKLIPLWEQIGRSDPGSDNEKPAHENRLKEMQFELAKEISLF